MADETPLHDLFLEWDKKCSELGVRIATLETAVHERFSSIEKIMTHNEARREELQRERKAFNDQRYISQEAAIAIARHTSEVALSEAKDLVTSGFEKTNQWRQSINDVIATRLSRSEYDTAHKALIDKLDSGLKSLGDRISTIENRIAVQEGRSSGVSGSLAALISVAAVVIALVFGILNYTRVANLPVRESVPAAPAAPTEHR